MTDKTYFIKPGYIENPSPITDDSVSGSNYWNKSRLHYSRYYQYPVYSYAGRIIEETDSRRVIDVGCGPATKLSMLHRQFPEVDFTGIDLPNSIAFCRQTYNWGTWIADSLESPSELDRIEPTDLSICSDVIEHLVDPDQLLTYLRRVTRPGGHIVLSTPERDRLHGSNGMPCPQRFHVREWNYAELQAYLRDRGFTILEHFFAHPMRYGPNYPSLLQFARRLASGLPLNWNQVCLLQID